MRRTMAGLGIAAAALVAGCPQDQRNAFLTLTETLGATSSGADEDTGGGSSGGGSAGATFRQTMTVTLVNNNADAELNVGLAAWVNTSSIRTAAQQDALIAGGYVQLTQQATIGTVFTLPPGTFVLNGPGNAGTTRQVVGRATANGEATTPTEESVTIITPDVILLYLAPPTSCESPAYEFTIEGFPVDANIPAPDGATPPIDAYSGSNFHLGVKTLAQMETYQCSPLRPGLFRKVGGGARADNEFFDGENIRMTFNLFPDANGNTANVVFEE